MAKKKKKVVYKYKDWILDSQGEQDFCYYLQELQDNGYIEHFKRGQTLLLSSKLDNSFPKKLKTKTVTKTQSILQEHVYTYDFVIKWTNKGMMYFCNNLNHAKWEKPFLVHSNLKLSYIECKPNKFDFNNMTRLVKINIKWAYQKFGMFIQIIQMEELMKNTFVPEKLLLTATGKVKKYNFEKRTLEGYLEMSII